jgi:hypothetical protein
VTAILIKYDFVLLKVIDRTLRIINIYIYIYIYIYIPTSALSINNSL